jgi:DNA polymerase III sliding clamp (beta) subunit (PCNA family)
MKKVLFETDQPVVQPEVIPEPVKRTRKRKAPAGVIAASDFIDALEDVKDVAKGKKIFDHIMAKEPPIDPREDLTPGKIVLNRLQLITTLERAIGFVDTGTKHASKTDMASDDILMSFHPQYLEVQYMSHHPGSTYVKDMMPLTNTDFTTPRVIVMPLSILKKLKLMKGYSCAFIFDTEDILNKIADPETKEWIVTYTPKVRVTIEDTEFTRKSYIQMKDIPLTLEPEGCDDPVVGDTKTGERGLFETAHIKLGIFVDDLNAVAYCIGTDETKRHLMYIDVQCNGLSNKVISTDGHRLALREIKNSMFYSPRHFMINKSLLKLLNNMAKEKTAKDIEIDVLSVGRSRSIVRMRIGSTTIQYKTDYQFPPWAQVVPDPNSVVSLGVDTRHLLDKLKTMKGMLDSNNAEEAFVLSKLPDNNYFEIREVNSTARNGCSCRVNISATGVSQYENFYNIKFMIEALERIVCNTGSDIRVNESHLRTSIYITNGTDSAIIMPVRN